MKRKSIIACTAMLAVAIGTDHGATAAGSYTKANAWSRPLDVELKPPTSPLLFTAFGKVGKHVFQRPHRPDRHDT